MQRDRQAASQGTRPSTLFQDTDNETNVSTELNLSANLDRPESPSLDIPPNSPSFYSHFHSQQMTHLSSQGRSASAHEMNSQQYGYDGNSMVILELQDENKEETYQENYQNEEKFQRDASQRSIKEWLIPKESRHSQKFESKNEDQTKNSQKNGHHTSFSQGQLQNSFADHNQAFILDSQDSIQGSKHNQTREESGSKILPIPLFILPENLTNQQESQQPKKSLEEPMEILYQEKPQQGSNHGSDKYSQPGSVSYVDGRAYYPVNTQVPMEILYQQSHQQDLDHHSQNQRPAPLEEPMDIIYQENHQQDLDHHSQNQASAPLEEPMEILYQENPSNSQDHYEENENFAPVSKEEPMDIIYEENPSNSSANHRESHKQLGNIFWQPKGQEFQQVSVIQIKKDQLNGSVSSLQNLQSNNEPVYHVEVISCSEQTSSLFKKNNDIYGLNQKANISQKPTLKRNDHVSQERQPKVVKFQQPEKDSQQSSNYKKRKEESNQIVQEKLQIQEMAHKLMRIKEKNVRDQAKVAEAFTLLSQHIDLLFLKPKTHIGKAFLTDGQLATIFIEFWVLRQADTAPRGMLENYIALKLEENIISNQEFYQKRFQFWIRNRNSNKKSRKNSSIAGVDGSQISGNQDQPIKRTQLFSKYNDYFPTPNTFKATLKRNKDRSQTEFKDRENLNASDENNDDVPDVSQNQPATDSKVENQGSFQKPKQKRNFQLQKLGAQNIDHNKYGTKYHYTIRESTKFNGKQVIQTRTSARLSQKADKSKSPKPVSRSKSPINNKATKNRPNTRQQSKKSKQKQVSKTQQVAHSPEKDKNQEVLNIDYLKDHLRQIRFSQTFMERDYEPLTQVDKQISELLRKKNKESQESQQNLQENNQKQAEKQIKEQSQSENQPQYHYQGNFKHQQSQFQGQHQHQAQIVHQNNQEQPIAQPLPQPQLSTQQQISIKKQKFKQQKQKYKIQIPIVISKVINPDVKNHGIYALLQLSRTTQIMTNAKYALTPITSLLYANKRCIEQALKQAKDQAGEERDNLVYVPLDTKIMNMIRQQKNRRNSGAIDI